MSASPLELRPEIQVDESARGGLARAAALNGFSGIRDLGRILNIDFKELYLGRGFDRVATLLGCDHSSLSWSSPIYDRSTKRVILFGQSIRPKNMVRSYLRWCDKCWQGDLASGGRDAIYCRASWEIGLLTRCDIHQREFTDKCQGCGMRVAWHNARVDVCSCGASLFSNELANSDREERVGRNFERYIRDRIAQRQTTMWFDTEPVWALSDLAENFGILATYGRCRRRPKLDAIESSAVRDVGFDVLKVWPDGPWSCLDALINDRPAVVGPINAYGWFYDWLYASKPSSVVVMARDLLTQHARERGIIAPLEILRQPPEPNTISMSEATRILGMGHERTRRVLGSRGLIPPGSRTGVEFRIDRKAILGLERSIQESVTKQALAKLLDISPNQVRRIISSGHLAPIVGGEGRCAALFLKSDAEALVTRLATVWTGTTPLSLFPLPWVCRFTGIEISRAIDGLLRGELSAARIAGVGLSSVGVNFAEFRALKPKPGLSLEQAASKLGMRSETVRKLLGSGLMSGSKIGRQWIIPEQEVVQIGARYATPAQLCLEHGISFHALKMILTRANVVAVIDVPTTLGRALFDRAECARLFCQVP